MTESIEYHIEKAEEALGNADSFSRSNASGRLNEAGMFSHIASAHIALASLLVSRQMAEITERMQVQTMALSAKVENG